MPIPSNNNDIRFISKLSNIKFNTHNLDIDELSFAKKFLTLSDLNKNTYSKKLLEIFSEAKNISTNNDLNDNIYLYSKLIYCIHNVSAFYNNNNKLILSEYSKISQRIFSQVCIKLKLRCINTVEIFQNIILLINIHHIFLKAIH